MDIIRMQEAMNLARQTDALLSDAGVYDNVDSSVGFSFQMFYEDLESELAPHAAG